ncbi:hypothetical protein ACI3EY_08025 [Ornithinimicrobium sp. LYQ92]|uniref:hypothetical protein n=1 Tax=Serinicoccus sp. LYQ92 TaxID=3378798 RepID=UPI0038547902
MPMPTDEDLHAALLVLLAPITRNLHQRLGKTTETKVVNAEGIDLHDGHVFAVAHGPDGTALPYMVLWPTATTGQHTRLAGGRSMGRWGFQLTVAAGSPAGVRWALGRLAPVTARARLVPGHTGLLTPYFDQVQIAPDEDVDPIRWSAALRYETTVH